MEENQKSSSNVLMAKGEGKTLQEAKSIALEKLEAQVGQLDPDKVEIIVLSEGSKGFLGMGSAMARVEVRMPGVKIAEDKSGFQAETGSESVPPAARGSGKENPEAEARLRELLEKVIDAMGLEASVSITYGDEEIIGNIAGDDLGLFIGRHGQTMDAVQYLSNIITFRGLDNRMRVVIDAEDYRDRRVEVLESMADRGASEVLKGKNDYELKPMSAAERRIVHMFLQDRDGIETFSEGREPFRRVIIARSGD
ncbi:MAG: RNA-binding cell elongation regulator Jag/EloR [Thermoleophilia bacterium]